jgi:plastocyanin
MPDNLSNPVSAVVQLIVAGSGAAPVSVDVEPGGTLEWTNDSHNYPEFEIQFVGPSPVRQSEKLVATNNDPIVIHLPEQEGEYVYHVRHVKHDGTCKLSGPFRFSVRSCPGCGS